MATQSNKTFHPPSAGVVILRPLRWTSTFVGTGMGAGIFHNTADKFCTQGQDGHYKRSAKVYYHPIHQIVREQAKCNQHTFIALTTTTW